MLLFVGRKQRIFKRWRQFMKTLFLYIILFLTFILSTSFHFHSIDVDISGKIYRATSTSNLPVKGAKLFVKYKGEIIAETETDKLGHYEITINVGLGNGLTNTYDFYVTSTKIDTCFIKSIRQFKSEEFTWNIKLPGRCR